MLQKTGLIAIPLDQGINLESTIKYYVKPELVQTIFDIGAHNGSWAKNIGKYFPNARIYLFEANSAHFPHNPDIADGSFNVLLSNEIGVKGFYSIGGTGDSIYQENSSFYFIINRKFFYHFCGGCIDIFHSSHKVVGLGVGTGLNHRRLWGTEISIYENPKRSSVLRKSIIFILIQIRTKGFETFFSTSLCWSSFLEVFLKL